MTTETDQEFVSRMRLIFERNDAMLAEILGEEPGEKEEKFYQSGEIDAHFENTDYPQ